MSNQKAVRQRSGSNEDPLVNRWRGIGIAAVAAAKSVKPASDQTRHRDATVQRLIDSVSDQ